MDASSGFVLIGKETDQLGFEHYRYQQTYKSIPIREAVFLIHVRNGKIESYNGTIYPTPTIQNSYNMDESKALTQAISYVNASEYMWQRSGDEAWIKQYTGKPDATYFPLAEMLLGSASFSFAHSLLSPLPDKFGRSNDGF